MKNKWQICANLSFRFFSSSFWLIWRFFTWECYSPLKSEFRIRIAFSSITCIGCKLFALLFLILAATAIPQLCLSQIVSKNYKYYKWQVPCWNLSWNDMLSNVITTLTGFFAAHICNKCIEQLSPSLPSYFSSSLELNPSSWRWHRERCKLCWWPMQRSLVKWTLECWEVISAVDVENWQGRVRTS